MSIINSELRNMVCTARDNTKLPKRCVLCVNKKQKEWFQLCKKNKTSILYKTEKCKMKNQKWYFSVPCAYHDPLLRIKNKTPFLMSCWLPASGHGEIKKGCLCVFLFCGVYVFLCLEVEVLPVIKVSTFELLRFLRYVLDDLAFFINLSSGCDNRCGLNNRRRRVVFV